MQFELRKIITRNPHGGNSTAPVQNISTSFKVSAPSGKT